MRRLRRERQIEQRLEWWMIEICTYPSCILNLKLLLDRWIVELLSQASIDHLCGSIELRKISAFLHLRETVGKINGNEPERRQQQEILA